MWSVFAPSVQAAPPDLTATGTIASLKAGTLAGAKPAYGETYNLGPTGLRGWIYLSGGAGNTHGEDGTMTGESRQILVTVASAPGNAVLAVDDVILGAMASNTGTVPNFSSDARKAFGAAIGEAEKTGAGTLRAKRWRGPSPGTTTEVNIPMTIMGDYTATAPYSCPKSTLILANARNKLAGQLLANSNFLTNDWSGAISGLALLAGVQPGDPDYATVQTRLQTYARARASAGPQPVSLAIWDWAYSGLFLAEYYLATGDVNVLPGINSYTLKLAQSQSITGTFGHDPSVSRPDGSGRRMNIGYGPVNAVGIVANIAIVMGKKALLAGGQAIDPEIDGAIQRGSDFFAFYVNKGPIPYGEHEPFISSGHSSNGKDPMCSVLFGLQAGRAAETEYYSRMTIASYRGRESGHTGQGFSYLWSAMGANMGGALAVAEYLKPVRWHLDLSRRTDGSFAYDGAEHFGGGSTSDGTYLGASGYYGMNATASYILTYSLPLQRLYVTGKRDIPANPPPLTLDAPTVSHAVAAANFQVDCPGFITAQLITSLSDYDPVVRHYAAVELGKRTLSGTDLTTLRNMVTGTNANGRMGACQALGLLKDSTALPTIVNRLDRTTETDLWVRAKAASAIRSYTSATASTHRDTMLTRFTANATDPDVIVWSDPIQMSNTFLSLALFGDAIYGGGNIRDYTINAAKNLLYPAVQAGLKQPDSYSRSGASRFCFDKLTLTDVQAVIPDFFKVVEIECLADRMWSADSRANGINTLSKYKVSEGIPYALAMLNIPAGFEWGSDTTLIAGLNALAAYGDAARWTLPTLRGYLGKWDPTSSSYTTLVSTIASIENAITAPAQAPGLCVANSQVVTTTGAKAITLSGASPRGAFSYLNVTQPAHGTVTGTAPNLTYTPTGGYTGPDQFTFQTTDTLTTSTVTTVGIVVGSSGNGFKGEYFNNMDFTSPVLTRTDSQINFDWGTGSPHPSIGADTFSIRWSGLLLIPQTGNYTFSTLTSDGARLYVNGKLVIDRFVDQSTRWTDGNPVYLKKGEYAEIYLEYYENTGSAVAKLKWTGPGFAGANGSFIPQTYLFDGSGISNRQMYAFPQNLTTNLNTALPISLSGTGGTLTYTVLTQPANGTLSGTAPYLTYTPNNNFSGNDSFTFLVNNGTKNSLPATVSISVQAGPLTSYTWASAVSGNWSDAAKWTPSQPAAAGLPYYALNFTTSGTYTATHNLNNAFQLNQLNVASNVTIAGTQSVSFVANGGTLPQLNQSDSGTVNINHPIVLQATTTLGGNGGGRVILAGTISGNGGIIKNSPGILQIDQKNNSYSGGTILNAGWVFLPLGDGNPTPALGSGSITLNPGSVLEVNRTFLSNNMILSGGTVRGGNSFESVFSGSITLNGISTFDFGTSGGYHITGNMSGPGGFTYTGPFNPWSQFLCSGINTYTGPTMILAGTLSFPSVNSVAPGPLLLSTGSMAKLNYTGTRVIESLTLNGALMPPGTYGSSTSTATNKNNTYFSGNGTLTVPQPTTTALALTSGSTPANPGTSLTFTATVTGSTPTGNVQFYSGSTLLGTAALNGSFQAALTTTQLAIGSNSITARYVGNSSNSPSTSTPVVVEINNTPVAAPTGLSATPVTLSINLNWTASTGASGYYVKRSTTNGGPYSVIAHVSDTTYQDNAILNGVPYYYVVSAINAAGESASSNQATAYTGSPTATNTALTSSPVATGAYGTSVTFTATVTSGSGTPSGTVTFRSGSNVIGTATLSSGTASLAISTLAPATYSITASYAGSLDPSTSSALSYQVTQKPLTITGVSAANKVYDGTTAATLSGGTLSGVIGGDTVTIIPGIGSFANANVGTWAVTTSSYSLGGAQAANYTLSTQPTVPNATITARPIQITGTKTYDGTTAAPIGILTIANNVDGGNLSLTGSAELSGKDAGNRTIITGAAPIARVQTAPGGTTANNSNSTSIIATLPAAPANGNTLIAVISTRNTSTNQVSSITGGGATWTRVSQAANANGSTTEIWVGPNVSSGGTAITINHEANRSSAIVMEYSGLLVPTSFDVPANNTGNGTSASTGTTAVTSQANQLWLGGIGANSNSPTISSLLNSFTNAGEASSSGGTAGNNTKVFALQSIVTTTGTASTGGTLSATAQWSGAIATFKAAPSLTLTGTAAANYTLTGMTSSVTVNPKPLSVSGVSASNKNYDGTTAASLSGTPSLLSAQAAGSGTTGDGKPYTGDTLSLGGTASGTFATKHVGNGKLITVTGATLGGAQAGNYTLTQPTGLTANVTQLPINVAAVSATKTYDGTTTAAGTPTLNPTLVSGDTANVLSQAFESANAGTANKVIIPSIDINDGNSGGNYAVTLVNFTTGTINKAPASITLGDLLQIYNGSPRSATAITDPAGKLVDFTYDLSTAPPTAIGSYGVIGTVNDPNYSGTASGTLVITAESITDWRAGHFTAAEITAGLAADGLDADGDGFTNLDEYTLGTDPRGFTPPPLAVAPAAVNHISLVFVARRATGAGYAGRTREYDVEYSPNLPQSGSWQPLAGYSNIVADDGTVEITLPASLSNCFYRLNVRIK